MIDKSKRVSKERLALIQLSDAVDLLNRGNYISAITLAGAAEEILGRLCKIKKAPNALEIEFFLNSKTLKDDSYRMKRNLIRNELKHIGEKESFSIAELEKSAYLHISAAIINYKLLKNKLPNSLVIREYCKTRGLS